MEFSFDDHGAVGRLAVHLADASTKMGAKARALVRHHGTLLQTQVKANASGRPGPRAPTGDYRRSINLRMAGNASTSTASVGTDRPQGRRLEGGFRGTDSLGRSYDQPPYPHFGPAIDKIQPGFEDDITQLAVDILEGT